MCERLCIHALTTVCQYLNTCVGRCAKGYASLHLWLFVNISIHMWEGGERLCILNCTYNCSQAFSMHRMNGCELTHVCQKLVTMACCLPSPQVLSLSCQVAGSLLQTAVTSGNQTQNTPTVLFTEKITFSLTALLCLLMNCKYTQIPLLQSKDLRRDLIKRVKASKQCWYRLISYLVSPLVHG